MNITGIIVNKTVRLMLINETLTTDTTGSLMIKDGPIFQLKVQI